MAMVFRWNRMIAVQRDVPRVPSNPLVTVQRDLPMVFPYAAMTINTGVRISNTDVRISKTDVRSCGVMGWTRLGNVRCYVELRRTFSAKSADGCASFARGVVRGAITSCESLAVTCKIAIKRRLGRSPGELLHRRLALSRRQSWGCGLASRLSSVFRPRAEWAQGSRDLRFGTKPVWEGCDERERYASRSCRRGSKFSKPKRLQTSCTATAVGGVRLYQRGVCTM